VHLIQITFLYSVISLVPFFPVYRWVTSRKWQLAWPHLTPLKLSLIRSVYSVVIWHVSIAYLRIQAEYAGLADRGRLQNRSTCQNYFTMFCNTHVNKYVACYWRYSWFCTQSCFIHAHARFHLKYFPRNFSFDRIKLTQSTMVCSEVKRLPAFFCIKK
jgi:hypothetical protein